VFEKSELKTIFIDSSQLKNENCIFDKNFVGHLESIEIAINESKHQALLTLTDNKSETRLDFFNIKSANHDSFELEIDNTETSTYLSQEYFCLKNFKIVKRNDEVSFFYVDTKDG
jgi:hypothetical protein